MSLCIKRIGRLMIVLATMVTALAAWQQAIGAEDSKAESEGIIFERQQVMTQLNKDAETLGNIVAGLAPADKLVETTNAIAQGAHDAVESFKNAVPGGRSKPEVWSNNGDFSARMARFATNADAMAKLAKTGNLPAVTSMMGDAMPCRECHDVYREKKTPPPSVSLKN